MLFIASASTYRKTIAAKTKPLELLDLPRHVHEVLGLHGLLVPTDMLAGADIAMLDRLREHADKAACPCLVLEETEAQPLADASERTASDAVDRMERVLTAAHRLGCSAAALRVAGTSGKDAFERAVDRLRRIAAVAERFDLNLLIRPGRGPAATPEALTEIVKRVGGFRLGSLPDFEDCAAGGDPETQLRRLAPYAPTVIASAKTFTDKGHEAYDLEECARALVSVGYDGAVAIDYRGTGDMDTGVRRTREAIEPILTGEQA